MPLYDPPYTYDDERLLYDEACLFYDGGYSEVCLNPPDPPEPVAPIVKKKRGASSGASSVSAPSVVIKSSIKEENKIPDFLEVKIYTKISNKENNMSWKGIIEEQITMKTKAISTKVYETHIKINAFIKEVKNKGIK